MCSSDLRRARSAFRVRPGAGLGFCARYARRSPDHLGWAGCGRARPGGALALRSRCWGRLGAQVSVARAPCAPKESEAARGPNSGLCDGGTVRRGGSPGVVALPASRASWAVGPAVETRGVKKQGSDNALDPQEEAEDQQVRAP